MTLSRRSFLAAAAALAAAVPTIPLRPPEPVAHAGLAAEVDGPAIVSWERSPTRLGYDVRYADGRTGFVPYEVPPGEIGPPMPLGPGGEAAGFHSATVGPDWARPSSLTWRDWDDLCEAFVNRRFDDAFVLPDDCLIVCRTVPVDPKPTTVAGRPVLLEQVRLASISLVPDTPGNRAAGAQPITWVPRG